MLAGLLASVRRVRGELKVRFSISGIGKYRRAHSTELKEQYWWSIQGSVLLLIALPGVCVVQGQSKFLCIILCPPSHHSVWVLLSSDSQIRIKVGSVFHKCAKCSVGWLSLPAAPWFYRKLHNRKLRGFSSTIHLSEINCPHSLNSRPHKRQHTSLKPGVRLLGWSQALIKNVAHVYTVVVLSEQSVNVGCTVWQCSSCRQRADHGGFSL